MNCPYCNTQVTDGTQKCPFCGQQVSPGNTSGSTSPRCPRCGAGLANGAKFCSTCGASLQQTAYGPTMPPPVPPAPAGQYMFCPHCRSQVPFGVSVCPVCNARLNTTEVFNDSNGTAIAAFVMALLSLPFPVLTIPAIVCGHIGLAHSRRTLGGQHRPGHGDRRSGHRLHNGRGLAADTVVRRRRLRRADVDGGVTVKRFLPARSSHRQAVGNCRNAAGISHLPLASVLFS